MIKSQFTKENQDFDVTNRVVSSLTIDDDEQENNLRPHSMDEYVGQEKIKKNLEVFISAAKARNDALDHVLLYGPPGLGKTTLAHVIASELGAQIRVTSGPAIEKAADLASSARAISPPSSPTSTKGTCCLSTRYTASTAI